MSRLARSVDAYLGHLEVERGLSANTLAAYRRDLGRYVDYCAGLGLTAIGDVSTEQVEDFLVALAVGDDETWFPVDASGVTLAIEGLSLAGA